MPLTPEGIERFRQEHVENNNAAEQIDRLFDVQSSAPHKRIESRLKEMFDAPQEKQQEILDRIVAEEFAQETGKDTDL